MRVRRRLAWVVQVHGKWYYWLIAVPLIIMVAVIVVLNQAEQAQALANKQWSDLHQRGVLRVGIDPGSQPFSFYSQNGWEGLDADLTGEIAHRMGLRVQTDPVGYDSMYDALHLWQVDIVVSAVVADPSRTSEFAYTESYFDAGPRLVSLSTSEIRSINDLANKRIAVALGSNADRLARYWERRLVNVSLNEVNDEASSIDEVRKGEAQATIVNVLAASKLDTRTGWRVVSIAPQPYVIALRRDNPRLLAAINSILNSMRADGTLQAIVARWTDGQ